MTRTKTLIAATALLFSATVVVWAQVQNGNDFDPATAAVHGLVNPPAPGSLGATPNGAGTQTPEQLAEQQRQQAAAALATRREEAKKKAAESEKARKEKATASKAAEDKRMAAQKTEREKMVKERKAGREQLKALEKEEQGARKAYHESLKNATGSSRTQAEEAFRKSEADRRKKMAELRHPKKKSDDSSSSSSSSGSPSTSGSIGLSGTTTTH